MTEQYLFAIFIGCLLYTRHFLDSRNIDVTKTDKNLFSWIYIPEYIIITKLTIQKELVVVGSLKIKCYI